MGVFHQDEAPNSSKKCKFLTATLKDAFSGCGICRQVSTSSPEEKLTTEIDYEQEIIISTIRNREKEKSKQRSFVLTDNFSWGFSLRTGELFLAPKIAGEIEYNGKKEVEEKEEEDFISVGSCFSCCSSGFISVKTNFSRCSSFSSVIELHDFSRLSIFQQLCNCEGWPFGLCRKAVLLPPLPKSPSESWSWHKGSRIMKMH